MPFISSVEQQNKCLDAWLGSGHAANQPATVLFHIYTGDPENGGTELTSDGGYAPKTLTNDDTNFPPASLGEKTSAAQTWTFTGPTSGVGTWGVISDGTTLMYDGPLSTKCDPNVNGDTFTDSLSISFPDTPGA